MALPVSNSNRLSALAFQPILEKTEIDLEAVRQARGDINEIRMQLKGNVSACHDLFKQAVKEEDVISQIQLSQALFGMKWGKDKEKDFSSLQKADLEEFSYHSIGFALFNSACEEILGVESDSGTQDARTVTTFRAAADRGYLSALLELMSEDWTGHTKSYGFAVQLRPFVGQGDKQLDHCFGVALKDGCAVGSDLYYEGLYWMNRSMGITVHFPPKDQSFEDFKSHYLRFNSSGECYDADGFCHVGNVVLAPSREAWDSFVKEKLEIVRIASSESYSLPCDLGLIKRLVERHEITGVQTGSFVESSVEGYATEDLFGRSLHGFQIESFSIYQNSQELGTVSVRKDTLQIHETFAHSDIQPVIEFVEMVLKRTGSNRSVHSWLMQME